MPLLEITFPADLQQFFERQAHELNFATPKDYVISLIERALTESSHEKPGITSQSK